MANGIMDTLTGIRTEGTGVPMADPNMLAGILASTALRLYKSSLSPEDYDSMIDMISETRNEVLPFNYIKAPEDLH